MTPGGGVALESRQRITGGATGAVALLPRASGGAVDVAYPSGNVVVVSEVSATGALSDAPVVIRPGSAEDGATSPPGAGRIICAWAPGAERAGLLAIGALRAVHLYAPSDAGVGRLLTASDLLDPRLGDFYRPEDKEAIVPVLGPSFPPRPCPDLRIWTR